MKQFYSPVLFALSFLVGLSLFGQDCLQDTIPPDILVENGLIITLEPGEARMIHAYEFDSGTTDNCSEEIEFRIEFLDPAINSAAVDAIAVNEDFPATNPVRVWAKDEADNWVFCDTYLLWFSCTGGQSSSFNGRRELEVNLQSADDAVDVSPFDFLIDFPVVCGAYDALFIAKGSYAYDQVFLGDFGSSQTFTADDIGTTEITIYGYAPSSFYVFHAYVTVLDENGMGGECDQDITPPLMSKGLTGHVVRVNPVREQTVVFAADLVNFSLDNCTLSENLEYRVVRLENATGQPPASDSLVIDASPTTSGFTQPIQLWVGDEAGNWNFYTTYILIQNDFAEERLSFGGMAFFDLDADCVQGPEEPAWIALPLEARLFRDGVAIGAGDPFYASASATGAYNFALTFTGDTLNAINGQSTMVTDTSGLQLLITNPLALNTGCQTSYLIDINDHTPVGLNNLDMALQLEANCTSLFVDIGAPFLRRCEGESTYGITYANYGTETAMDAYVEITFDEYLSVLSSTIPWTMVVDNTYTFPIGDLAPGHQGSFGVSVQVSCDAVLGQTHCTEAHIYPDTLCGSENYNGPSIEVTGFCDEQEEEVVFRIKNVGQQNMLSARQYIVVEDVIMLETDDFMLDAGDDTVLSFPANGSTYRVEAQQVAGHPGFSLPSRAVEGCGTNSSGAFSLGFVSIFPQNDFDPYVSIDCQDNIGSFDPNDKQGYPLGVGEEHLIRPNVNIDYRIRFQNTGTDTAFTVVIRDTLSEHLDALSIRPGVSSHIYSFQILEENILEFRFDNILLPDSTTNLEASQGYVQFTARQQTDNPDGTLIENSAAIYFDQNEAVITNTTQHRIGEVVVIVNEVDEALSLTQIKAYPNPTADRVQIEFPVFEKGVFTLYHVSGQLVMKKTFEGEQMTFDLQALATGSYYFSIRCHEGRAYSGTVILAE